MIKKRYILLIVVILMILFGSVIAFARDTV